MGGGRERYRGDGNQYKTTQNQHWDDPEDAIHSPSSFLGNGEYLANEVAATMPKLCVASEEVAAIFNAGLEESIAVATGN
jgi:hypothetical protein